MSSSSSNITQENLVRKRGDNYSWSITLTSSGTAVDISSDTVTIAVNSEEEPTDTTNQVLFLTADVATDGVNGVAYFTPTEAEMDITPETYYYEIQRTTSTGQVRTIMCGTFLVEQDIDKS